ncbi:MAG: molybdopterin molybdotransferase MoeA [Thermaerobacter sp.]|nr:molybdopterin molybdotransferase MoeA [Thermaerobacter sp.]
MRKWEVGEAKGPRLDEALAILAGALPPVRFETVPAVRAVGRRLARDLVAQEDLPPFDTVARDGYALRAAQASCKLEVAGWALAGVPFRGTLRSGEAVAVATGAPLPAGCDAVVPYEATACGEGRLRCRVALAPGDGVHRRGEEVAAGVLLAEEGEILAAGAAGTLVSLGLDRVAVGRRPRVGILATGSELAAAPRAGEGQIRSSNPQLLEALVRRSGGVPVDLGTVPDDPAALGAALERPVDVCLITGGSSRGAADFTRGVLRAGAEVLLDGVAMRPGGTLLAVRRGGRLLLGLPGTPGAVRALGLLVVGPLLHRWQGAPSLLPPEVPAALQAAMTFRPAGVERFVEVRLSVVGGCWTAGPPAALWREDSAYARIPPGTAALAAGDAVGVLQV